MKLDEYEMCQNSVIPTSLSINLGLY